LIWQRFLFCESVALGSRPQLSKYAVAHCADVSSDSHWNRNEQRSGSRLQATALVREPRYPELLCFLDLGARSSSRCRRRMMAAPRASYNSAPASTFSFERFRFSRKVSRSLHGIAAHNGPSARKFRGFTPGNHFVCADLLNVVVILGQFFRRSTLSLDWLNNTLEL
jgi:hypothetical protein